MNSQVIPISLEVASHQEAEAQEVLRAEAEEEFSTMLAYDLITVLE